MEIKDMDFKAIETRKAEITAMLDDKDLDIDKLEELDKEVDALEQRKLDIEKDVEVRKALLDKVAKAEDAEVIEIANSKHIEERNKMETIKYDNTSVEFRNAFLKNLMGKELTEVEERAFLHTTANTGAVIPKELENKIYSNMEEQHPILADVNVLRTGTVN